MKIPALLLTAALSLSAAASALTLSAARVVTLPGADTAHAAVLPGGRVAVNADNGVLILDASLKTQIGWYSLRGPVTGLSVSPDGTRLAAMTGARWTVWDVASGRELRSGTPSYDATLAFDPQGNLLTLDDGTLRRIDLTNGRATDLLGNGEAYGAAVSPDGRRALLTFEDRAELLDIESGEVLARAELQEEPGELAAAFSPDGQAVTLRTGSEALILRAGQDAVTVEGGEDLDTDDSLLFLNDRELLLVSYGEGQRIDAQSGRQRGEAFEVDSDGPVVPGPNGTLLALGSSVAFLNPAKLDTPASGRVTLPSSNAWTGGFIGKTAYAGVGRFTNLNTLQDLKVGDTGRLYDFELQGDVLWTLNGETVSTLRGGKLSRVATLDTDAEYDLIQSSPDGTFAVTSGYYGLALLNGQTGKVLKKVTEKQLKVEDIHAALPTADGKAILVVPHEGNVFRYDVATGKQTPAFKVPTDAEVNSLRLSRGGTLAVMYSDGDGEARVALVKPGATSAFKTLEFDSRVRAATFSPDGKLLAVLTSDPQNALQVFDTASGARLARTGAFNMGTSLLAWAPAGNQLMVGAGLLGKAGSVTLFDVNR
ncbi:WD40 repeat domain-containing protein [Deinococcus depolymerans]|uniref:Pyrrolo-quinoline quinone repeat domain-containing protein n=1 Tax=Deinococcus depolymerans TaxID=392408 RepID=A0ABN1BV52_9DEIO